ncbi:MAG: hypothetical protein GY865_16775, partial [candidate division Zixibacteria bacterium]|nr:hypothetical protein [candidate division Zixibacteria bacterium]
MKRIIVGLTGIIILLLAFSTQAQSLLRSPESAIFDEAHDRYLVGNWNTGDIVQIDLDGNQSYFNTDLYSAAGIHIAGNKLYVCSNGGT